MKNNQLTNMKNQVPEMIKQIFNCFRNEFINQSNDFIEDSKLVRTKRIQTILENSFILEGCMVGFGIIRGIILFIESSSLLTTIAFSLFLPGIIGLGLILHFYFKQNKIPNKKDYLLNDKALIIYENQIGMFSSLISFWILFWIPITIYFEYAKFDKGIQFMMSKMSLHLNHIILMQPKKNARFCEVFFSISYFIILIFSCFSYTDLFFALGASVATYFIFYIADKISNEFKIMKEKDNTIMVNSEIFKMIQEPIVILDSSLKECIFKNQAFKELQKISSSSNEIDLLSRMKNENNCALSHILKSQKIVNEKLHSLENSCFLFSLNKNIEKNESFEFSIKAVRKKLKHLNEEVTAVYFHDIGKEIEIKVMKGNIEFTHLMLYSLSHEVRTPLNGMQGILQLMKTKGDMKYYRQIKLALSCSQFLENQINCMLDYAQILKNEFKLHLEFVNIETFLTKIHKISKLIIESKHSSVEIKLEMNHVSHTKYIIDKERVKEIILNLLTNSIKYTSKGQIILKAEINSEFDLIFSISDSGTGFSEDQVMEFNNFETHSIINKNKAKNGFPGYKLSICQLIASQHQSKIILFSQKSKGSTFSFKISVQKLRKEIEDGVYHRTESGTLMDPESTPRNKIVSYQFPPINNRMTHLNANSSLFSLSTKQNKYIIIADDVELNRFVIQGMINKLNFQNIKEASNGLEALNIAKDLTHNGVEYLIFMDIDMPVLNGIESTRLIREFSKKPIIAVTAFIGEDVRIKAKESGMNLFVTKPISFNKIKSILRDYNFI